MRNFLSLSFKSSVMSPYRHQSPSVEKDQKRQLGFNAKMLFPHVVRSKQKYCVQGVQICACYSYIANCQDKFSGKKIEDGPVAS